MDLKTRPQYYDGQYLGADDLEAIVEYVRVAQAQHALGAHAWGIGIGLDLVERNLVGDDVEVVLTPGLAWDGYAHAIVAPAPQRIGLDRFADFQDDTPAAGVQLEIWLIYRELPAQPPGVGFSCPDDDLHARIVETFQIEVRRRGAPVDPHKVSIANRSLDANLALSTFDATKPPLHDESVPHQALPASDRPDWPIFAGLVRWRKDPGQAGRLIKRTDLDRNQSRAGRRYLGAVAETILAADGVLRLRDRGKDPADPILNFAAPIVAAPAGASVVNDLVWCEGHLRVVGDARLQAGKLDYRVAGGGDDQIPMYLQRVLANAPIRKTTLDAFIGPPPQPPGPPPSPPLPETRFTVSTNDGAGNPKECLTVVTDGRVGVNAPDPTNTLEVKGPTGIRYSSGYITGDEAAAWTAFAFNAYTRPGGPWVIPDLTHKPTAIVLDDNGGVPEIKLQTNNALNPAAWDVQVVVKGDTGNVGIGNVAPTAKLHVHSSNLLQGDIQLFSATADIEYDGGSDREFVLRDSGGGKTTWVGTDLGIGVRALDRLHVAKNAHLNAIFDRTDFQEHLTVVVGSDGSGLRFSDTNDFFISSQPYAARADTTFGVTEAMRIKPGGNVGIGTVAPQAHLHVSGPNNQYIDISTTDVEASYVRLMAVSSNHKTESQLQFKNELHFVAPLSGQAVLSVLESGRVDVTGDLHITGDAYKDSLGWWWLPSDATLKKDIGPIANPLNKLLGLKGVSFNWREPKRFSAGPGRYLGFVAQDVEEVFPEWVKTTPAGTKAVNPVGLEALLVEAIRELTTRTDRLETQVASARAEAINPAGLEALFVEAIQELRARTDRLEAEVAALREQLGRFAKRAAKKPAAPRGRAARPRKPAPPSDSRQK